MSSRLLVAKREEYAAKHKKLLETFAEAGPDRDVSKIKSIEGTDSDKVNAIGKMNAELKDMEQLIDGLTKLEETETEIKAREEALNKPAGQHVQPQPAAKAAVVDLGKAFTESAAMKAFRPEMGRSGVVEIPMDLKTVMSTGAGFAPESLRTGIVVPYVRREPRLLDIIPTGPTGQAAVVYMEQTTRTNTAVEVTESTGYTVEATLAYTARTAPVENVGVHIPVTDQQLEDVQQVASIINVELTAMLRERIDYQLLNGTGSTPYLKGLNATAYTGIQSFASGVEKLDDIYEALKRVRVTGRSVPDFVVMHPNNWQTIRLMKTNDGLYKMGNPLEAGLERIWGVPVVQHDACAEGTVVTGAFGVWCKLWEKRGILIEVTDSHASEFIYFKKTVRASIRVAFTATRPVAFCLVTGF